MMDALRQECTDCGFIYDPADYNGAALLDLGDWECPANRRFTTWTTPKFTMLRSTGAEARRFRKMPRSPIGSATDHMAAARSEAPPDELNGDSARVKTPRGACRFAGIGLSHARVA